MEGKIEALDSTQKELEFIHSQNAYLTQKLKECTSIGLGAVKESFENVMQ